MRVLNLVATLSLVGAACYSPSFKPCQFTCEGATKCPGDLTCGADSVCHEQGATDSCSAVVDGGGAKDGGAGKDGGGSSACTTLPAGTTLVSSPGQQCLALSTATEKWVAAKTKCGTGGWQLAVFSMATPVAGELPAGEKIWIGLQRANVTSTQWTWVDGSLPVVSTMDARWSPTPNSGINNISAAYVDTSLYSDNASMPYRYACTKGLTPTGN